ncbi:MAG: A24 family peptidase [Gemmataceae bacterium]|nr:A24 family peptidase [Gemmataceae bacterium]
MYIHAMGLNLPLPVVVVLAASLVAACTDLWKFRVHNLLTLPLLVSGLVYHLAVDGTSGLGGSFLGLLFGFGSLFPFYLMGGMGGGDVKLMAAVGAWLGMPLTLYVFLVSAVAMGIYAVVLIVAYSRVRETWINLQILWHRIVAIGRHLGADQGRVEAEVARPDSRGRVIPFAPMIAVGIIGLLVLAYMARP